MKINIETIDKLYTYNITSQLEDTFIMSFEVNGIPKSISLIYKGENWTIESSNEYTATFINPISTNNILNIDSIVKIDYENTSVLLYTSKIFDDNYIDVSISNLESILIGNDKSSNIIYSRIKNSIEIKKEENYYFLYDKNNECFINKKRFKEKRLKYGDVLFIKGIKIIFMKEFMRIIINQDIKTSLNKYQMISNDASKYSALNDIEKNTILYNEDDLFFHTPQLKFNIKEFDLKIDPPPEEIKEDEIPAFLTYGTSMMMGVTSIITGAYSIIGLVKKTTTFSQALPSLSISFAMIIGSVLFPIISNKLQRKNIRKRELKRKEKYTKYLEEKDSLIQNTIKEQTTILNNNFISPNDIVNNLKNNSLKIWNKEITDVDFLTLRLGLGSRRAQINIDAPNEEFNIEDDILKQNAINLANTPMVLKDIPITVSLVENNVFPLILECTNKNDFIKGIILQLISYHSPNDLKLVFFLDKETEKDYEYVKYIPHILSQDKSKRFFATTEDQMKDISQFIENEYTIRKSQKNNIDNDEKINTTEPKEYYKNNSPYYLIITNSFKLAKDQSIINKILETNSNYGFSLLILESNLKNLPSKCEKFAKILDTNSGLFGKDLSSKDQSTYKADYLTNIDMEEVISIISNIPISSLSSESILPKMIEFVEMYNVGKIEQLNISSRWGTNNSTNSLAASVGVYKSGNKFYLDLHEKFHGPHGLIAGMTGSGKSEFIITYILSMAINYHPYDVQFVLIDYKGGGLAGAFENRDTGVVLPHVIGTITNLDNNEMNRSLVSIKSELKRRQKIFNEVREKTGESTIDIYKYQRLYKEGIINKQISHLFIICDEFAELKANQPDFMDELISTARIGRSLGVHLILATQKPSGVVNDQIWSNTRFRVCLKVQSTSDSMEMLKRPEAANIKETGRFYLQVGYDELFELGQSAWAGAKYQPSEKYNKITNNSLDIIDNVGNIVKILNDNIKKDTSKDYGDQLSNIVKYIYNLSIKENINFNKLWLPKIPDEIYLQNLIKKYDYKRTNNNITYLIGEYDNPEEQMQGLYTINVSQTGNTVILGIPGSGKENMISTMIVSTLVFYTPEEVNFYILDFGSESLKIFDNIPHIGDIVTSQEKDKISGLLSYLDKEINKRKQLFANYNGNYNDYIKLSGNKLPTIITFINNYDSFIENYENEYGNLLYLLFREGYKYGIVFTIAATGPNAIRSAILQYFSNMISLQLGDPFDYKFHLNAPNGLLPSKIFGRGLGIINENVYEYQTAQLCPKDKMGEYIRDLRTILNQKYPNIKARSIPQIPSKITSETLEKYSKDVNNIPLGIDINDITIYYQDFFKNKITQISGNSVITSPTFICGVINSINKINNINIEFIDVTNYISLSENEGNYYSSNYEEALDTILTNILNNNLINFIIINGIKEFLDNLSNEYKIKYQELLKIIKSNNNTCLLLIDDYNAFKKLTLDDWYVEYIKTNNGIWIGNDINSQILIEINNLLPDDANQSFNGLLYSISNGNYTIIKGIGDEYGE